MSQLVDRIEEFPKDGRLWWIRWVDRYSVTHGGTATPSVDVFLSLLDVPLNGVRSLDLRQVVTSTIQPRVIRLFTGYIPRLALGSVFRDGVEVACLPLQTMQINGEAVQLETLGVMDELSRKPAWRKYPYRVIRHRDYYLAGCVRSQTVVVTTGEATVVLPCHEVFRAMYAPYTDAALALTSGPWEMTQSRVIEPTETGVRADGRWQIVLRSKTKDMFAHVLANLCLNDVGRAAANGIYTALLGDVGTGYMKCPIPFNLSQLTLQVRGICLDDAPRKFLALQICSMNWPIDIEMVYRRENSGDKGKIQTPVDKPKPYSNKGAGPSADMDGFISANSSEDPSANGTSTNFALPSMQWHNTPRCEKEEKLESFIYSGGITGRKEDCLTGVAAGTEWYGETCSGPANYSQERRDASLRFAEVVDMLDRLKEAKEINGWNCISHPRPRLVVGGLPVWHFPENVKDVKKTPGFCYLSRNKRRLRSALVCEIHYRGNVIYWLEIEVGPSGNGFRSLIFGVSVSDPSDSIFGLIDVAMLNRGVWPKVEDIVAVKGVASAELWIHSYIGRGIDNKGGRLNEVRALMAISTNARLVEQARDLRVREDRSDIR